MHIQKFKNLRIEINSDCNRKCVFCPRGTDITRWEDSTQKPGRQKLINKKMETNDVLSLLDQNIDQDFNAAVSFVFYNEPVLDDRLVFLSEYAKNKGTRVILTTNGDQMLSDPVLTQEIFRVNDVVSISLYDYKDEAGRKKLMDKWHAYLKGLGISGNKYRLTGEYQLFGNRAGLIDRKEKYMRGSELDKMVPLNASCRKIHQKMNIRYDGEVAICCDDAHIQHSLGNVLKSTLADVWYGDRMQEATELLAAGNRAAMKPCNICVRGLPKGFRVV
jgi:2-deoxy-scyllo-inosamine dehydrogenase (SAM-dependent)